MTPQITSWDELTLLSEEFDPESGKFQYTMFVVIGDNDFVYFGQLNVPKQELSFQQITSALCPISDDDIFPAWRPSKIKLKKAPEKLPANIYVKRPMLIQYDVFKAYDVLHLLPQGLLEEA